MGVADAGRTLSATSMKDTVANDIPGLRGRFLEYVVTFVGTAINPGYNRAPALMRGCRRSFIRRVAVANSLSVGGVSAAVSKTAAAPIERVKLLIQNQVSIHHERQYVDGS
jgi:hypothetical protein